MANAKEMIAGVGTRYGTVFTLASDGKPNASGAASATPTEGTLISGIKALEVSDPSPRRFNHIGNDSVYAQDSLPATEVGTYSFTTSKVNFDLDNTVEGTKTRNLGQIQMRAGNSDSRGNEPQVMSFFYRQALAVDDSDTATFGSLRQWHGRLYPSSRISPGTEPFGDGTTDKSYEGTPTPIRETPWGESLDDADWGATQAEYIDLVFNNHPRINIFNAAGSQTTFQLSHRPVSSAELTVIDMSDGSVLTPSAVNTSSTNPAFTLGSAPSGKVLAFIGTDEPGTS